MVVRGDQRWGEGYFLVLLRNVARASRWELVGVDEEPSVWVTRVDRHHPVVDVLLGALALVAWSQETAGRVWSLASFQASSLSVVVMSITVFFGDMLQNDSPVSFDVHGSPDLGIVDVRWAKVAFWTDPVAGIVGRWTLGSTSVVGVIESVLLVLGNVLNQIISRLVSHIRVLLEEDRILRYLVGNLVLWIFRVFDAEWKVGVDGTFWGGLGVTVAVWGWVVGWHWVVGDGVVWGCCQSDGNRDHHSDDLQKPPFLLPFFFSKEKNVLPIYRP